jgi:hypothetical protein
VPFHRLIAGGDNCLQSTAHAHFLEELCQINFNRCHGQSKPICNLLIV